MFGICTGIMKLFDHFVVVAQRRRLSEHTIECYLTWVRQFMTFSAARHVGWTHPKKLGTPDVEAYLNDLVVRRRLSASSQNQALCALCFLYRHVLDGVSPNEHLGKFLLERSRRVPRMPTVLAVDEVRRIIGDPPGAHLPAHGGVALWDRHAGGGSVHVARCVADIARERVVHFRRPATANLPKRA